MMTNSNNFKEQIAADMKKAEIPFLRDIAKGGLLLDFLVFGPDGSKIVVAVKRWQKEPGFQKRAAQQARHYHEVAGADHALVVVEKLKRSRISEGVVTGDRLVEALYDLFSGGQPAAPSDTGQPGVQQPTIFAAMPFDPKYDDVFFVAMAYAAESVGAVCRRVDRVPFSSDIVAQIKTMIEDSLAVIVDLSESKPNVLYEAGFAHGLAKKTIHISSTPLKELPFDVRNWQTMKYELGQTYAFREQLALQLKGIIS